MSIVSILTNNKTHIIYGVLILVLVSICYNFFRQKPKEIIKTLTETKIEKQIVNRDVVKTQTVYVDRVIETKKANGDVITETQHVRKDSDTKDKTKIKDSQEMVISKTEVIKFLSSYTIDVMYPVTFDPVFNPLDLQIMGGVRVFSLPVFITFGTNGHLNQFLVGARIEF